MFLFFQASIESLKLKSTTKKGPETSKRKALTAYAPPYFKDGNFKVCLLKIIACNIHVL